MLIYTVTWDKNTRTFFSFDMVSRLLTSVKYKVIKGFSLKRDKYLKHSHFFRFDLETSLGFKLAYSKISQIQNVLIFHIVSFGVKEIWPQIIFQIFGNRWINQWYNFYRYSFIFYSYFECFLFTSHKNDYKFKRALLSMSTKHFQIIWMVWLWNTNRLVCFDLLMTFFALIHALFVPSSNKWL